MDNIGDLAEIAAYKAAEKSNDSHVVFHGELSPCRNFHPGKFTPDGLEYPTAEHYIQYQKALYFRLSHSQQYFEKYNCPRCEEIKL